MAEVLLFHHALGQTVGFFSFADELRKAGISCTRPTSSTAAPSRPSTRAWRTPSRSASRRVIARGERAAASSLTSSSTPASRSAWCRRRSWPRPAPGREVRFPLLLRANLVFGGVAGAPARPGSRHGRDPIFVGEGDLEAARELVASAEHGEVFLYPGDQHYFADSSLPSYDADAAALLTRRVLDFLQAVDAQDG